jgi:hypothetical protein
MKNILVLLFLGLTIVGCHFGSGIDDAKDNGKSHIELHTN